MGSRIRKAWALIASGAWLLLSGCSTPSRSIAVGAAGGAGVGGTAGLLADPGPDGSHRIRNVLIGTGVGGALGAGTGFLIGRSIEKKREAARAEGKMSDQESIQPGSQPQLVPAKTEARWVPDQVRGNIFIPAHYEYLIVAPSHWRVGQ